MTEKTQERPPSDEVLEDGVVLLEDSGRKHVFDDPANVKRLIRGFFVVCGLLLALDILFLPIPGFPQKHFSFDQEVFSWENFPGFFSFYGLGACVALVLLAKQLRKVIMRKEDYYDR